MTLPQHASAIWATTQYTAAIGRHKVLFSWRFEIYWVFLSNVELRNVTIHIVYHCIKQLLYIMYIQYLLSSQIISIPFLHRAGGFQGMVTEVESGVRAEALTCRCSWRWWQNRGVSKWPPLLLINVYPQVQNPGFYKGYMLHFEGVYIIIYVCVCPIWIHSRSKDERIGYNWMTLSDKESQPFLGDTVAEGFLWPY
jgi:hypothetical protein